MWRLCKIKNLNSTQCWQLRNILNINFNLMIAVIIGSYAAGIKVTTDVTIQRNNESQATVQFDCGYLVPGSNIFSVRLWPRNSLDCSNWGQKKLIYSYGGQQKQSEFLLQSKFQETYEEALRQISKYWSFNPRFIHYLRLRNRTLQCSEKNISWCNSCCMHFPLQTSHSQKT